MPTVNKTTLSGLLLTSIALISGGISPGAVSQDSSSTTSGESRFIEEVIVTAQKREIASQDLGVSLSVITGDSLREAGILSTSDIADSVANLNVIDNGGGFNLVEMRGIADISTSIQTAPTVGFYVDEYSAATSGGFVPDLALFDAQRVEVLRGPQGTLFGDGSLSGTIRLITNSPDTEEFSGRFNATASSTEDGGSNYGLRALLNIPLAEDVAALRLMAGFRDNDGWYDNPESSVFFPALGLNFPDTDVQNREDTNDEEISDFRAALLWHMSDKLTANLDFNFSESEIGDTFNGASRNIKDTFINEPRDTETQVSGLTLRYDLGSMELVSATSYFDQSSSAIRDASLFAIEINAFVLGRLLSSGWTTVDTDYSSWSQELRLSSTGDNTVDWTVGLFYRDEERDWVYGGGGVPAAPFAIIDDYFNIQNQSYAAFGELSFDLSAELELVAGLRYFETERESDFAIWGVLIGPLTRETAPVNSAQGDDDTISPKVTLNWHPSDDMLFYVTAAKGFRAGGSNATAPLIPIFNGGLTVNDTFDAEDMWNFELGAKTMLFDRRLQLNAYVFQMDWSDTQVNAIDNSGLLDFFFNAGESRNRGLEVEWIAYPTANLQVSGGLAVLDTEYQDNVFSPLGGSIVLPGSQIVTAGNELPRSPDFQFNLMVSYQFPITQDWNGSVVASYVHQSDYFSDTANSPSRENDAADVFDLRIGAETANIGIHLFADNLTDEEQTYSIFTSDTSLTGLNASSLRGNYRRPRTIGIDVSYSF